MLSDQEQRDHDHASIDQIDHHPGFLSAFCRVDINVVSHRTVNCTEEKGVLAHCLYYSMLD